MKRMLILSLALLAGCHPGSPQALRDHPAHQKVFVVPSDYETVYGRILEPLRAETHNAMFSGSATGVEAQLYAKRQAGTISVWYNGFSKAYPLVVDLRQADPETTQVRICYSGFGLWPTKARRIEAWATGSR